MIASADECRITIRESIAAASLQRPHCPNIMMATYKRKSLDHVLLLMNDNYQVRYADYP